MNSTDFQLMSERLEILLQLRRAKEAIGPARELVAAFPDSAQAWLLLARCSLSYDTLEIYDSLDAVNKSIGLDPHDSFAFVVKGWILWQLEHPNDARASFEQALRLNPDSTTAHALLAKLNYSESRIDECWDHVVQGLSSDPFDCELLAIRTKLQLQRNNLDSAEEIVRSGLQHHPDHAEFHKLLGQIHLMRSEFLLHDERLAMHEQSRTALREAQRLNPNCHDTNAQLIWIEMQLEELRRSLQEILPASNVEDSFHRPAAKPAIDIDSLSWKQHISLTVWDAWYELKSLGTLTVVVFCLAFAFMLLTLIGFAINPP